MALIQIEVNRKPLSVEAGQSLRKALFGAGVYVPGVCDHPDLDAFRPFQWSERVWRGEEESFHSPFQIPDSEIDPTPPPTPPSIEGGEIRLPSIEGGDFGTPHCNLCLVSIDGGDPCRSCDRIVKEGMRVRTDSPEVVEARKQSLKTILARHPHACLTCAQRHGCDRIQCSMNVPVSERCCELLGRCEIGKVSDWIGIPPDTPAYHNESRPSIKQEPLFLRDYELCIGCTRCVKVCRDVRGVDVLGAVLVDGAVVVGTQGGPLLAESLCRFCGACVEVCPTGALRDQLGSKPLHQGLAPCSARCPLEIDVPGYMELISEGAAFAALELIREKAVLPGVLGYACFHPCEANCRRGELGGPASICALKRYVADEAGDQPPAVLKQPPTGKRVAVIGSGPAGLAATADLLRLGHAVTVFEAADKLGGMLRQTIPNFRLPDEVIDRDLKFLFALGMEAECGVAFGKDVTAASLRADGFDSIVIAVGLAEPVMLNVEGEALQNVLSGLTFLRHSANGSLDSLGGRVVVIGGGSVAVDAAMSARRLGAESVTMIALEAEGKMPAHPDELEVARQEGIEILNGWGVERFAESKGVLTAVVLKKCVRVLDSSGKFSPEYDPAEQMHLDADWAIVSIGQRIGLDRSMLLGEGVFACGDAVKGPTSIVEAMAEGRKIALQVDRHLGGNGQFLPGTATVSRESIGRAENFTSQLRLHQPTCSPDLRVSNFDRFIETMTAEQAKAEAARCLRCHLRAKITPAPLPPDPWRKFELALLAEVPALEGVIILADGGKNTVKIAGSANLKQAFRDLLDDGPAAEWCRWECDPMYTKRESELIQEHLQAHGEMPGGDELDDLF